MKRGRKEVDEKIYKTFTFTALRDAIFKDEAGLVELGRKIRGRQRMEPYGTETEAFFKEFAEWLITKQKGQKVEGGPCKVEWEFYDEDGEIWEGSVQPAETLNLEETLFYFDKRVVIRTTKDVYTNFLGMSTIYPLKEEKNSMYIDFFCARQGNGTAILKFIFEHTYRTVTKWVIDSVPSAVDWWRARGFDVSTNQNKIGLFPGVLRKKAKKRKKGINNNYCAMCLNENIKFIAPEEMEYREFCSKECCKMLLQYQTKIDNILM